MLLSLRHQVTQEVLHAEQLLATRLAAILDQKRGSKQDGVCYSDSLSQLGTITTVRLQNS